jgi:hypothetical protein
MSAMAANLFGASGASRSERVCPGVVGCATYTARNRDVTACAKHMRFITHWALTCRAIVYVSLRVAWSAGARAQILSTRAVEDRALDGRRILDSTVLLHEVWHLLRPMRRCAGRGAAWRVTGTKGPHSSAAQLRAVVWTNKTSEHRTPSLTGALRMRQTICGISTRHSHCRPSLLGKP